MSEKSSESGGEWIVLNDDEDLSLENIEQSLISELSYDAVCYAVSDSIRSSLSTEELEWQYEQFQDYLPLYRSHVQELGSREFDVEDIEGEDSNAEDEVVNKCVSTSDIEEENLDVASISKFHSYKHHRNDHLNFLLNLMLALVLASTIGLGIGHFIGWSHKCYKNAALKNKATDFVDFQHVARIEQEIEHPEKQVTTPPLFSENLSNSASCSNFKDRNNSPHSEVCSMSINSNIITDTALSEGPMVMSSDMLELRTQEEISKNNFSDSHVLSLTHVLDVMDRDWSQISDIQAAVKRFYDLKKASDNIGGDFLDEDGVDNIELEFLLGNSTKGKVSESNEIVNKAKSELLVNKNKNFHNKDKLINNEFQFLEQFFAEVNDFHKENYLTNQLRNDLNEVIQSLAVVALARLTDTNEEFSHSVMKTELIVKLYNDFQILMNARLTDINNFVLTAEYKKQEKVNLKYLQKMVYSLVDAVDHLMKVSFKTLNRDTKNINVHKFSNNISKVIYNFNKKWGKNNRFWSEIVKKIKTQEFHERYFKKEKENKHWKRKNQLEKYNSKNYKYERYSMKS